MYQRAISVILVIFVVVGLFGGCKANNEAILFFVNDEPVYESEYNRIAGIYEKKMG